MSSAAWRKRFSILKNWLYLYPEPEPLPHTWMFWVATAFVTIFALTFATYFSLYLTGRHAAFMSNAEDLGIMDQAIWNTIHGNSLQQTVCNIVHDTNCYGFDGVSRFAIHFEPMLYLVSLFYLIWSDPRTLLVLQAVVVASGALPAFWLARLRLRNEWAGVAIAALYLLYPAQQFALVNDFHAVTFTASFLLFTLYFLYTRRTVWLLVFVILSMACKEEIPIIIFLLGIWTIIFQRQWRIGIALIALPLLWIGLWQVAVHFASPTGTPLLQSRYTYLGKGLPGIAKTILLHPGMVIKGHVLERTHLFYVRVLLTPAGYLPLLAPWVLVLAVPSMLINLLSSDPNQYSGMFQYNAEIVPILIFSTIEAIVLIVWVAQWLVARFEAWREQAKGRDAVFIRMPVVHRLVHIGLLLVLITYALFNTVRADASTSMVPFGQGFSWPQQTAHTQLANTLIGMIPPDASVSAQSALVPHISHRTHIYLFPYGADGHADYVFLDVTGDIYPSFDTFYYTNEVKKVLFGGQYGVVAAQDGYLLLKRGLPPPGYSPASAEPHSNIDNLLPNLPDSFCSFTRASEPAIPSRLSVTFASSNTNENTMNLVGYNVAAPNLLSITSGYQQITTYWSVAAPTKIPWKVISYYTDSSGTEHFLSANVPAFYWCPTASWKPGTIVQMKSWAEQVGKALPGPIHLSVAVVPFFYPYSKIMDIHARLPLKVLSAPANVVATGTNGLQLASVTLTP